jgi:hypothetical protein
MRAVILLLASSGMRISAIPSVRLRHLEKVNLEYGYGHGFDQYFYEYFTFSTPECASAIDLY